MNEASLHCHHDLEFSNFQEFSSVGLPFIIEATVFAIHAALFSICKCHQHNQCEGRVQGHKTNKQQNTNNIPKGCNEGLQ